MMVGAAFRRNPYTPTTTRTTPYDYLRNCSSSSLLLIRPCPSHRGLSRRSTCFGLRWQSNSSNNNNNGTQTSNSNKNDSIDRTRQQQKHQAFASTHKDAPPSPPSPHEVEETARQRLASGAAAATQQLEQRFKQVVHELNLGDQLAVLLIAVFTAVLLTAPYAVRHMKEAAAEDDDYGDRLSTEDFVDEFAKLARTEWGTEINAEEETDPKNVVEVLLKDVFKSTALQHAAQEFVVQILQSDRFKEAVSRLVKELWSDLVNDPETVAQVVKLLEIAIQNPDVKKAAQELVLQVFVQEAEVREALIGMIQQLGQDDVVRQAVVRLLTDSAHTTLNDPDLLDHSMEFATDVVGDDIVQQTAGEALRKSVGHAVRPATTVLLAAAGVGFLIFGVLAIGYSRSSEQEAVLFESAARSLQSNATFGIMRILTWPLRALQTAVSNAVTALWMLLPERPSLAAAETWGEGVLDRAGEVAYETVHYLAVQTVALPWRAVKAAGRWLYATANQVARRVGESIQRRGRAGFRESLFRFSSVLAAATSLGSKLWSHVLCWSQTLGRVALNGVARTGEYSRVALARIVEALQGLWRRITQRKNRDVA